MFLISINQAVVEMSQNQVVSIGKYRMGRGRLTFVCVQNVLGKMLRGNLHVQSDLGEFDLWANISGIRESLHVL